MKQYITNVAISAQGEFSLLPENSVVLQYKQEILDLCEAFGKSGQSGGSAPYTSRIITDAITSLLNHETMSPLTGEEWEWGEGDEGGVRQNLRDSRVFKNTSTGRDCFIDAIVFVGDKGGSYTSSGGTVDSEGREVSSSRTIKSYPFTPKTFYVDVLDHRWAEDKVTPKEDGDWWTHTIKDENQLKEALEYYGSY